MSKRKELARARRTRSRIGRERRRLKNGEVSLTELLKRPEENVLGRCRVYDVLISAPGLSAKGAKKICLQEKIWPLERLQDLQLIQREDIINALPPRARR